MKINRTLLGHAAVLTLLAGLWELLVRTGVLNSFFVSSPSAIALALLGLFRDKDTAILVHAAKSLRNLAAGYSLAVLAAVLLGVPAGYFNGIYRNVRVYARMLYSVPPIAYIPLVILWLGIGELSKIGMVFIMTFFTVFMAAMEAARSVNRELSDVCRVYGAGPARTLFYLVLPACARPIIAGAKLGVGRAVGGMLLGETFGIPEGLGYLLFHFGASYMISRLLGVLAIVMALSIALFYALDLLENKLVKWSA